ncbi:MAG: hypothetical protein U0031_07455 [Thermomicrobiales bacterium]
MERAELNAVDQSGNELVDFASRRTTLEHRLEEGYRRIDEAALAGADVSEWEQFWIRLLREYEGVCRDLDRAA